MPLSELPDGPRFVSRFNELKDIVREHYPKASIPSNPGMTPVQAELFAQHFDEAVGAARQAQERYERAVSDASDRLTMAGDEGYTVPGTSFRAFRDWKKRALAGEIRGVDLSPEDHLSLFAKMDAFGVHVIKSGEVSSLDQKRDYRDAQVKGMAENLLNMLGYFVHLPPPR